MERRGRPDRPVPAARRLEDHPDAPAGVPRPRPPGHAPRGAGGGTQGAAARFSSSSREADRVLPSVAVARAGTSRSPRRALPWPPMPVVVPVGTGNFSPSRPSLLPFTENFALWGQDATRTALPAAKFSSVGGNVHRTGSAELSICGEGARPEARPVRIREHFPSIAGPSRPAGHAAGRHVRHGPYDAHARRRVLPKPRGVSPRPAARRPRRRAGAGEALPDRAPGGGGECGPAVPFHSVVRHVSSCPAATAPQGSSRRRGCFPCRRALCGLMPPSEHEQQRRDQACTSHGTPRLFGMGIRSAATGACKALNALLATVVGASVIHSRGTP